MWFVRMVRVSVGWGRPSGWWVLGFREVDSMSMVTDLGNFLDSKVYGANMGPSGSNRTQVGPMLAPWRLLSGLGCQLDDGSASSMRNRYLISNTKFCTAWVILFHPRKWFTTPTKCSDPMLVHFGSSMVFIKGSHRLYFHNTQTITSMPPT